MTTTESTDLQPPEPKRSRWRTRNILVGGAAVLIVLVGAVGLYIWSKVHTLESSKYSTVAYTVPSAPRLQATHGETVYRIDPTQSQVQYSVDEKLFGHSTHDAKGTTNGISGDIAVNPTNPAASRVGQIVVNVEELHSDNSLRDAQIRANYFQSHTYPLAYVTVSSISGLPNTIVQGRTYHFTMQGQLLVKKTPAPVTWDVDAKLEGGKLTANASTNVKMSTFGIGPISIAGLVSTGDNVGLTMKLTALDPTKYTIPNQIVPPPGQERSGNGPSFKETVMPALQANCASCHEPGTVGAAHWTLATAGDAASVADGIGQVVQNRYMPPWPASSLGVPLAHSKMLDQKTIDAITKWADAGGQLDVAASTRIKPTVGPAGNPPRKDIVLRMPQAYTGSLSNPNDYRCFVLDPKITKPTYMTGYTVTPDQIQEIHHAQIFHIDASQAAAGVQRSGQDGNPGWSCYAGPSLPSRGGHRATATVPGARRHFRSQGFTGQPGLIAGWVPGQDPVTYPEHSGILLEPGDALVLQIHYHYDKQPTPDRSTVALQTEPYSRKVKQLEIVNPLAPVEIPCDPGNTSPLCNRDNALKDDQRLYGPAGSFIEPGLLLLCGKTPQELAATYHDGVASSSCDTHVPESGQIVGVLGHMHTLGKTFRLTLNPDTAQQKVLLDIPQWNFDWQMNYELQKPLRVTAGQTIRMQCSWDRSLDPTRPQKYIVFAEGTEDEMCFGTYALIPDHQG
ncbi:MAG TPA: YceI family protein [Acidimicrobiia bacterium]|jgi:polyisoprenoid-binding protein YceI